jgi:hypothetical protein
MHTLVNDVIFEIVHTLTKNEKNVETVGIKTIGEFFIEIATRLPNDVLRNLDICCILLDHEVNNQYIK